MIFAASDLASQRKPGALHACPVCGSKNFCELLTPIDPGETAAIVRCTDCQLATVRPLPAGEELDDLYTDFYAEQSSTFDAGKLDLARQSMVGYCKMIESLGLSIKGARFIDVGGALGYYTRAAKEHGMRVTLIERDLASARFARDINAIEDVYVGSVSRFLDEHDSVRGDIVFVRHVIEHVPDPRSFVNEIAALVAPGGMLVLESDNNRGVEMLFKPGTCAWYLELYRKSYRNVSFWRLLLKRPFAVDPPRHLFGFRLSNLTRLLEDHGLRVRRTFTYRLGDPIYWPNLPDGRLRTVATHFYHGRVRQALAEVLDILLIPLRIVFARYGLSSGLCVYAFREKTPVSGEREQND